MKRPQSLILDGLALLACGLAAVSATYLSGLEPPWLANVWHVPIILDFSNSSEGPNDPYHSSYSRFISFFWLIVRQFTTEETLDRTLIVINLTGNILMSWVIYWAIRIWSARIFITTITTISACFLYGLWGLTPLGYSDIFASYATHSQFSTVICIISLITVASGGPGLAGVAVGLAGNINLFMAFWTAVACGLFLVLQDKWLGTWRQVKFGASFILVVWPVLLWVLFINRNFSAGAPTIPISFFREEMAGHVFAFSYPRAFVQTVALGIVSGLAALSSSQPFVRRFGCITLSCSSILILGAFLPYLSDAQPAFLLFPLRFASIVVICAFICAASLFVFSYDSNNSRERVLALVALAGFMLKMPVLSLIGLVALIGASKPYLLRLGSVLTIAAMLASWLWLDTAAISVKGLLGAILATIVVALGTYTNGERDGPRAEQVVIVWTAWTVSILTAVPSQFWSAAGLSICVLPAFCVMNGLWNRPALAVSASALTGASLIALADLGGEPWKLVLAVGTLLVVTVNLLWVSLPRMLPRYLGDYGLAAIVLALVLVGFVNGARSSFAPRLNGDQADYLEAERWARANTPRDAVFVTPFNGGFSLLSRRVVWWDTVQHGAIPWDASLYQTWRCRRDKLRGTDAEGLSATMNEENIGYLVLPRSRYRAFDYATFPIAYENQSYLILARPQPRAANVVRNARSVC